MNARDESAQQHTHCGRETPELSSPVTVEASSATGDRSAAEASALQASEERYRSLFETMSEGLWIIEKISADSEAPDFRWVEANPAAERQTGGVSLTGKRMEEVFPENMDVAEIYDNVLRSGQPARFEYCVPKLGTVLDMRALPMRGASGRRLAVLFQDISERKRAEAAVLESDRRKDEYLAMLGHELRNPLGAIRNASELLQRADSEDSNIRRAAHVLQRQSIHMSRIIDGLLDVSRVARGKITLELAPLDVRRVIEGVLDLRKPEIESRGLDLELQLATESLWVVGDDARLVQVVDNLVANAIKFTHAGGSITVSACTEDTQAVIRVRDTGIGIRPEILSSIFEPFQQDTQDELRTSDGLGLGLSLAQGLVALHHGTIEAFSAGPGAGTELQVRLPLTAAPAAASSNESEDDARPIRILLVEDNADAAEMLCLLLQGFGHEVVIAETGGEALQLLQGQTFDIGLCDVGLPDMSGLTLARAIRNHPLHHDLTLIALTGYGQPEDRRLSALAGFKQHLTKPVNMGALKSALRDVQRRS